jgi:hypothetical protein
MIRAATLLPLALVAATAFPHPPPRAAPAPFTASARPAALAAQRPTEKGGSSASDTLWIQWLASATENFNRANFAAAESLARVALEEIRQRQGEESLGEADALDLLGRTLFRLGRFRDPEMRVVHERAVTLRIRLQGLEHSSVGASMNQLAMCLRQLGERDTAVVLARRALAIQEKALGPDRRGRSSTSTSESIIPSRPLSGWTWRSSHRGF